MKFARIGEPGAERPAIHAADGSYRDLSAHVADINGAFLSDDGAMMRVAALDFMALPELAGRVGPCVGAVGKFMCIGLNYRNHAAEAGLDIPAHPILFLKANSAICGPDDTTLRPRGSTHLDWEVELGVVIGKTCKYVSEGEALEYVAGYCVANDVSERRFQSKLTGQWTKGKSCDTFGPIGPWLVTADEVPDPQALSLTCDVNGTRMQNGTTRDMIFGVAEILAHLSALMTLHPGDVIATGTPAGVGMGMTPKRFLNPGDVVECQIEGLGKQRQEIAQE
ncbi:MAG: fumarylacetoacetate hydrolase family protein [Pseudomonadota bacterium]